MRLTTKQLQRLIAEETRKIIEEEGTFAVPLVKITVGNKSASIVPDALTDVITAIEDSPKTNPSIEEFLRAMKDLGFDSGSGPRTMRGVAPQGRGGIAPPARVGEGRLRRRRRH